MADALELVTIEEAARLVGKTPHNIRDYIQRGRIGKYNEHGEMIERAQNGHLRVSLKEIRVFLSLPRFKQAVNQYKNFNNTISDRAQSVIQRIIDDLRAARAKPNKPAVRDSSSCTNRDS